MKKKILALVMGLMIICSSFPLGLAENEQVINVDAAIMGKKNVISDYNNSLALLEECTIFEFDVVVTATAEVYLGHAQNKSIKFNEELCIEKGVPFELTKRQIETTRNLTSDVRYFLNMYWDLLESGEEFEKLNKENADWYTKIYLSSPEYPEFSLELEMIDKYVKINETKNPLTEEIIPESYFYSKYVIFDEANRFCKDIVKLDYLLFGYKDFDLENRVYEDKPLESIEKLTFEIDATEEIYTDFFTEITDMNGIVRCEVEQISWEKNENITEYYYIYTFEGEKGKIVFLDNIPNTANMVKETNLHLNTKTYYDDENKCFITDTESGNAKIFDYSAMSDNGVIEDVKFRLTYAEGGVRGQYIPARNVEYEFYKDSYEYNNRRNLFVLFHGDYYTAIDKYQPYPGANIDQKEENEEKIEEVENSENVTVYINGNKIKFDQEPVIKGNRTLVPMRVIFEALGAEVKWDEDSRTVTAVKDDIVIIIKIDAYNMYKNGESVELETAPTIVNNRTFVPVRAIAESFGNTVSWDGAKIRVNVE